MFLLGWDGLLEDAPLDPLPEDAEQYQAAVQTVDPSWDPELEASYVPRSSRPEEWTRVALIGQLPVRVAEDVVAGDLLAPGDGGIAETGIGADGSRRLQCLEILDAFDAGRGYAIALCLIG